MLSLKNDRNGKNMIPSTFLGFLWNFKFTISVEKACASQRDTTIWRLEYCQSWFCSKCSVVWKNTIWNKKKNGKSKKNKRLSLEIESRV